jgi:hypothetical protein
MELRHVRRKVPAVQRNEPVGSQIVSILCCHWRIFSHSIISRQLALLCTLERS